VPDNCYSYAHFVTIAKEIGLLENDMLELKEMLTEWKRAPSLLGAGTGTGDDAFGGYEVGKSSGNVCECEQGGWIVVGRLTEFGMTDSGEEKDGQGPRPRKPVQEPDPSSLDPNLRVAKVPPLRSRPPPHLRGEQLCRTQLGDLQG
jgi:hypothetical protein